MVLFCENKGKTTGVTQFISPSSSTITLESTNSDISNTSGLKRNLPGMTSASDSNDKQWSEIRQIHNYSASPRDVLLELQKTRATKNAVQKKLKLCRKLVYRLKKKVSSLKQIVHDLRKITRRHYFQKIYSL